MKKNKEESEKVNPEKEPIKKGSRWRQWIDEDGDLIMTNATDEEDEEAARFGIPIKEEGRDLSSVLDLADFVASLIVGGITPSKELEDKGIVGLNEFYEFKDPSRAAILWKEVIQFYSSQKINRLCVQKDEKAAHLLRESLSILN